MTSFSINTLGCKVNLSESDKLFQKLIGYGFKPVDYTGDPDYCIINTCTVTAESDRKARQLIRRIKRVNTGAEIIVTGCFTGSNMEFLESEGIDHIINNESKDCIPELLFKSLKNKKFSKIFEHKVNIKHSRPLIKVQDGCEQNCTYCIVPSVRGKYKSTEIEEIIREINFIENMGYDEVVLTGIHIGKYGIEADVLNQGQKESEKERGLSGLICQILKKTSIKRIRISSLEINEIDDSLLEIMKENNKRIAPHLHIPLQSGSDKILDIMGRPYNSDYFIRKMKKIREIIPGIAITTDILTGFPGESELEFKETFKLAKKLQFSKLHIFKYSPRSGTKAAKMNNQVDSRQKTERSEKLRKLGESLRDSYIESKLDNNLRVICERIDTGSMVFSGTSGEYIKVYFRKEKDFEEIHGKLIDLRSLKKYLDGLWAEVIN